MDVALSPAVKTSGNNWWFFWLPAATVAALSMFTATRGHFSVDAIREVVRLTAQLSLILFCTAFSASALTRLWPNALTRMLRNSRRQLGLAFAFSHGVHAIALIAFARIGPSQFHQMTDTGMFVFGGLAYLFIIAMAATSFDRSAAWLGPRAWRLLHTVGAYDIWLTFLVAESKRALHDVHYWPYIAMLVVVMALRLCSIVTNRR
jgi:DMSO/TMAO reductase YedYZ heme-binding membrane subunit